MKLRNVKNRPVLIEYDDIAVALPPKGVMDIGKKFSKSIKRALDLGEVKVVKEVPKKKTEKKSEKKVEKKVKKKPEKKPEKKVKKNQEEGVDELPNKKANGENKSSSKLNGGGLKSIKDLREEGSS